MGSDVDKLGYGGSDLGRLGGPENVESLYIDLARQNLNLKWIANSSASLPELRELSYQAFQHYSQPILTAKRAITLYYCTIALHYTSTATLPPNSVLSFPFLSCSVREC